MRDLLKATIDDLVAEKLLTSSTSPYASGSNSTASSIVVAVCLATSTVGANAQRRARTHLTHAWVRYIYTTQNTHHCQSSKPYT